MVATASQMGPVGYRDPAGGISPDGRLVAYTQGRNVVVEALDGGERRVLGPAPSQVRYLRWLPEGSRLAVHERSFDQREQWWTVYDAGTGTAEPLWGGSDGEPGSPTTGSLLEMSWSTDGSRVAGVVRDAGRSQVWTFSGNGEGGTVVAEEGRLSLPVFSPSGDVACIERAEGRQSLRFPCAEGPVSWLDGHEPYGHVAFSPEGDVLYYAAPGDDGVLELWARPVGGGDAERLASHARDAYGPTVTTDGSVLYKSQDYMVSIWSVSPEGGEAAQITAFQSETPTWSPDGSRVSFTFGRWRVATDDVNYPDIDQHIGIVTVRDGPPATEPDEVVRNSYSEDQGMHWSPNGRWIAYHSHIDGTDDVYLIPADDPSAPRQISFGGVETGWPRWSPDGRWISYPSEVYDESGAKQGHLYVLSADQESGRVGEQQRVDMGDFPHDVLQAEWMPDSDRIVFEAAEGAGQKALYWVSRQGGAPTRFHEWRSDQVHSGVSVSPDGAWVAYIGPGAGGFFQVFRVPFGGGPAEQVTLDESQKTQPSFAPVGDRVAYTVFTYLARFYRIGD
ncbi:MAG: hypothetical protein HKN73_00180 [Gemmatimonadetes bacterium]|nr:hypothetical protein [Gemmatimonadota bacterium]